MLEIATPECAICGRTKGAEDGWFLMVESRWQDKVKILQWHHQLAGQAGIHRVCGPAHAQELVVHWMTTGSMNYPFARTRPDREPKSRRLTPKLPPDVDTRAGEQIGELAIHRESIQRILVESPHSLTAILDALLSALRRDQPRKTVLAEREPEVFCGVEQEVI